MSLRNKSSLFSSRVSIHARSRANTVTSVKCDARFVRGIERTCHHGAICQFQSLPAAPTRSSQRTLPPSRNYDNNARLICFDKASLSRPDTTSIYEADNRRTIEQRLRGWIVAFKIDLSIHVHLRTHHFFFLLLFLFDAEGATWILLRESEHVQVSRETCSLHGNAHLLRL